MAASSLPIAATGSTGAVLSVIRARCAHVCVPEYRLNRLLSDTQRIQVAAQAAPCSVSAVPERTETCLLKRGLDPLSEHVIQADRLAVCCREYGAGIRIPTAHPVRLKHFRNRLDKRHSGFAQNRLRRCCVTLPNRLRNRNPPATRKLARRHAEHSSASWPCEHEGLACGLLQWCGRWGYRGRACEGHGVRSAGSGFTVSPPFRCSHSQSTAACAALEVPAALAGKSRAEHNKKMSQTHTADASVSLGRHQRNCSVCGHEQREDIEAAFVGWRSRRPLLKNTDWQTAPAFTVTLMP